MILYHILIVRNYLVTANTAILCRPDEDRLVVENSGVKGRKKKVLFVNKVKRQLSGFVTPDCLYYNIKCTTHITGSCLKKITEVLTWVKRLYQLPILM